MKNAHLERMERQAAKLSTEELRALYDRLPAVRGRRTIRQKVVATELRRRDLELTPHTEP